MSNQGDTPEQDKQADKSVTDSGEPIQPAAADEQPQAQQESSVSEKFRQPELGKIEAPAAVNVASGGRRWWAILGFLLLLAALAGVGWLYWQQQQQKLVLAEQIGELRQQLQAATQRVSKAGQSSEQSLKQSNQLQAELEQAQRRYQQLQESLQATQRQVQRLAGRRADDWRLAQAEHQINLAVQHLSYEQNPATALQLLHAADAQVAAVGDQSLQPLREAIAADIQRLRAVPQLDRAGVLARLSALQSEVEKLSLLALQYQPVGESQQAEADEEQVSAWQKVYRQFLKDFVVIKEHADPVQPMMTAEQRFYLDQSLILLLNQAQLALLRRQAEEFQTALRQLKQVVTRYFAADATQTAFIAAIDELLQQPVAPRLPQSLQAADLIIRINQERLYQWLQPENEAQPELLPAQQLEQYDAQ